MKAITIILLALALVLSACATQKKPEATDTEYEAVVEQPAAEPAAVAPATDETEGVERTVRFAYNSSALEPQAKESLDRMAVNLKSNQTLMMTVEGHTDDVGSDAFNLALGEQRAKAVRDYLVRRGVPTGRIAMISYGKERPAIDGDDEGSRSMNRRGDMVVK